MTAYLARIRRIARRGWLNSVAAGCLAGLVAPVVVRGQAGTSASNPTVRRAVSEYNDLNYAGAVTTVHSALRDRLSGQDQARAYEILGFAYAALDSARQATEALKQLVLLDPERDLDPTRISPKITSLYALALGQVLIVRHFSVDGGPFVAGGSEGVGFEFTVTRGSHVRTRITGPGGERMLDSAMHDGPVRVSWNGLLASGQAATSGIYRVIVEASVGRDTYAAAYPVRIDAAPVDTTAHLTALPGYALQPETVIPPRSPRPIAAVAVGVAAAAAGTVVLEPSGLNSGTRRALIGVSAGALLTGVIATVKRPAPVPSEANIRYNTLVRTQLAQRNAEIAADNATRRAEVRLAVAAVATVAPVAPVARPRE